MDETIRTWHNSEIGDLRDLIMLGTRQYDRSNKDLYRNTDDVHEVLNDAGHTLMGSRQENWFHNRPERSKRGGNEQQQ
jgi:alkaline phosphatase D